MTHALPDAPTPDPPWLGSLLIALSFAVVLALVIAGVIAAVGCGARPTLSGSGVGISVPWRDAPPVRRFDAGDGER